MSRNFPSLTNFTWNWHGSEKFTRESRQLLFAFQFSTQLKLRSILARKRVRDVFVCLFMPRHIFDVLLLESLEMQRIILTSQQSLLHKKNWFHRPLHGANSNTCTRRRGANRGKSDQVDAKILKSNTFESRRRCRVRICACGRRGRERETCAEICYRWVIGGGLSRISWIHARSNTFSAALKQPHTPIKIFFVSFLCCLLLLACFRWTGTVDKRRRLQFHSSLRFRFLFRHSLRILNEIFKYFLVSFALGKWKKKKWN